MSTNVTFTTIAFFTLLVPVVGCVDDDGDETVSASEQAVVQVALDPLTIPRFAHELPIPRTFAPTVIRSHHHYGEVIRTEYTVTAGQTQVQMLPPGYPMTTVMAYGGQVKIPGSNQTEFVRSSPGPIFENTRGTPSLVRWRNDITGPHFLPIDPTLAWANPMSLEPPTPPFTPFPGGYDLAQSPVGMVTHNHGLVVVPDNDGIAEQWFTPSFQRGPSFVTRDYLMPNDQPGTQLFYHDHVMGMTRISLYAGMVGAAYYIRDPGNPLDAEDSPLPKGQYEIPLIIFDRAFYTDGQLNFPIVSANKKNAYWSAGDGANTILVNGKVWPNLNVERRQYRFRTLAIGNGRSFNLALDNAGSNVPFTIIGSDGGYLPEPRVVSTVAIATTERADILVDFSQFPAGTQIIMRNVGGTPVDTLGTVMRFTVVDSEAVAPAPIAGFEPRVQLAADAPRRIKTLHNHIDRDGDAQRSVDGLDFSTPTTEFPLIGSTEQWDIVNAGGGPHQIHLHLIEFQLIERQAINVAAYLQQWHLVNGHRPVTRPIVVDPTPFLIGDPIPALPYETGWKDTLRANSGQVMRLMARWAPQEVPAGVISPGENLFPIEPVNASTNQWYLWHCHVLGHEDNDMMRKLPMVSLWDSRRRYDAGTVVTFENVNYRARAKDTNYGHQCQPPNQRFDLWERVNNNDGTWQPQIIYAVGDRVLHNGQLYVSRTVHQARSGQTPDTQALLWESMPMTACAQVTKLCADNTQPAALTCQTLGANGVESACLTGLDNCLAQCDDQRPSPCSGLCNNPSPFTVADGTVFNSGSLGTGATCFETESEIASGSCSGLNYNRTLTVNGREMSCRNNQKWAYPLPTQRNYGYCIQTTAGNSPNASFKVW
jgi:spore coat protein A, manganese oxidase